MARKKTLPVTLPKNAPKRPLWKSMLIGAIFVVVGTAGLVLAGTHVAWRYAVDNSVSQTITPQPTGPKPFPVSVDPVRELIVERPEVEAYISEYVEAESVALVRPGWLSLAMDRIAYAPWLQNIASPIARVLVIRSGERKEEVTQSFGKVLGWNREERDRFLALVTEAEPVIPEGKFAPGKYTTTRGATPEEVAVMVLERFREEIATRYPEETARTVPLVEALTIASLLEREAAGFDDMRYISGIIWNRLFADMNLQLDASLQYAKGSRPTEPWWPRVLPRDKYIESPFNTYENPGLPPAPIANPSPEAVLAALNPKKTECMYYFHDRKGGFHCSLTYEEHVQKLKQVYGRGR